MKMTNEDERDFAEETANRYHTTSEEASELLAERMSEEGCEFLESHFLRSDDDETAATWHAVRAALFGHLVRLGREVIDRYHSDLYRDVQWLMEHVSEETVFYYGVREAGTSIGTDLDYVRAIDFAACYRVELLRGRYGTWYVGIGKVKR